MNSRIAIALLCAGGIALACFPRPHESEASPAPARRAASAAAATLASTLELSVSDSAGIEMRLHLTNGTAKGMELAFPTGQTHEFYVLDSAGREVWRSSSGRVYTSALQLKSLGAGSTVSYAERWSERLDDGAYTAVAVLRSSNHPVTRQVAFSLP
jgi:hypothetical protein